MTILDLLKGKKINYLTDAKVIVQLEIASVEQRNNSRDLEPATAANDWWPKSQDWTTYIVTFTNGFVHTYNNLSEIKIL